MRERREGLSEIAELTSVKTQGDKVVAAVGTLN
jgi:hypothetical protein